MSRTASSYRAKLISSVYMRKVRQGPTLRPSGSYSIVSDFSCSPSTHFQHGLGKICGCIDYRNRQNPVEQKEGKMTCQNHENVVEEAQA